ncbi:MAG TPA: phosphotransferase [Roseiflexaceae bacterium]|nr:phosphotransferase [Roseiflexaceae bacterium]
MIGTQGIVHLPRPGRLVDVVRANVRPLDIAIGDVGEVLRQYGLRVIGRPHNLFASRRNHNVAVETPSGKKLLKRYRPQWRNEQVLYGHSIVQRLTELMFPVPALAMALSGESFVEHDGHRYALLDFVDGINYSGHFLLRTHRRKLMLMAGQTMARLHQTLEGFVPAGAHHIGFEAYAGARRRDAAWHISKVRELSERSARLDKPEDQPHADWLIQHSNALVEALAPIDELLSAVPLKRVIIHGDYGLHNLLFQADGSVLLIDFELARLEWRLSDLVSCLSRFRYADGRYDFQSIQWFVEAYHDVFPLSNDEWRLFPHVWRFYKLQGAVQYWNSYFDTNGPVRKLISARDAIEQAGHVSHDPDRLRAQIQGRLRMSLART